MERFFGMVGAFLEFLEKCREKISNARLAWKLSPAPIWAKMLALIAWPLASFMFFVIGRRNDEG